MGTSFDDLNGIYNALKEHLNAPTKVYTYTCPRCGKEIETQTPNFSVKDCEMICAGCFAKEYGFAIRLALNDDDKLCYRYVKYKETGDIKWLEME